MNISNLKALAASLGVGVAIGTVLGLLFALLADKVILYGIGTGLFVTGIGALAMGLLAATEPPEGWATGKGVSAPQTGRHSLLAKLAEDDPDVAPVSSWSMAVWGLVVGGALIALAMAALSVSS
jgi:hypothetical protein